MEMCDKKRADGRARQARYAVRNRDKLCEKGRAYYAQNADTLRPRLRVMMRAKRTAPVVLRALQKSGGLSETVIAFHSARNRFGLSREGKPLVSGATPLISARFIGAASRWVFLPCGVRLDADTKRLRDAMLSELKAADLTRPK